MATPCQTPDCQFFGNSNQFGLCSSCFRQLTGGSKPTGAPTGQNKKSILRTELKLPTGVIIQVRHGDMTEETVDIIVNAANSSLDHASGLAGAIIKKGGKSIQDESDLWVSKYGRLEEGGVAVTKAGSLVSKHIFHAVGPIWHGGVEGEEILLGMTVRSCLEKADALKSKSIAFPAISSGIFGFPKDKCAIVMFDMVFEYLKSVPTSGLNEIRFTNFDDKTVDIFETECLKRGGQKAINQTQQQNQQQQQNQPQQQNQQN